MRSLSENKLNFVSSAHIVSRRPSYYICFIIPYFILTDNLKNDFTGTSFKVRYRDLHAYNGWFILELSFLSIRELGNNLEGYVFIVYFLFLRGSTSSSPFNIDPFTSMILISFHYTF